MKLVKQDIQNIDTWLKNHEIKYIDIRYELMDHLISEYENLENYPDLDSFLTDRLPWCKKVAKEKQKALHWAYQKEVWIQFFNFFKKKNTFLILVITAIFYYLLFPFLTAKQFKTALLIPFFAVAAYQIYLLMFKCFSTKNQKEYISMASLVAIFSLPQLFLYCFGAFPGALQSNLYFLVPYITFGLLLNIAAILAFYEKRKVVVKEYEFLKVYLA
ncbi:MAG: hypothetical protein NWQ38_10535 [Cellulophaga sp.]|nr:hypothetical protein [Cellulophaga sp.]